VHVVHLLSSARLGGTEASVTEIVGSFREAYPHWSFSAILPQEGPIAERLARLGSRVQVLRFPARLARLGEAGRRPSAWGRTGLALEALRVIPAALAYRRWLARALAALPEPPGVVHAHGFKMLVLAAGAAPRGAAVVWHFHDYVSPRPLSAVLIRRLAGRCHAGVANSESVADDVRRVCGPALRVETIPNAVDLTRFSPHGPRIDLDALGGAQAAPPRTIRAGLLGTFGRWKGHRVFLKALARLPKDLGVRGYIIGGAEYQTRDSQESEASLRQEAAALGLGEAVVFTGPVEDAAGALRSLDIVVHASTEPEPFGMVIAEAMACGRAVIVSRAGGAAELFVDGVDALGHTPGDVSELAGRIGQLAADVSLRTRLGLAARQTAERRFDRARLARQLAPVYQGRRV
jgi:glycosyltransferase involved in cell wall biosynthesis